MEKAETPPEPIKGTPSRLGQIKTTHLRGHESNLMSVLLWPKMHHHKKTHHTTPRGTLHKTAPVLFRSGKVPKVKSASVSVHNPRVRAVPNSGALQTGITRHR